ncbi:MAG: sigma-54 interaction domain-containing protein [Pseudoalteromonas sp.]|nr:sigma-54 dependent transcriptional regulator [Pseudoalteromonas prydzensis]
MILTSELLAIFWRKVAETPELPKLLEELLPFLKREFSMNEIGVVRWQQQPEKIRFLASSFSQSKNVELSLLHGEIQQWFADERFRSQVTRVLPLQQDEQHCVILSKLSCAADQQILLAFIYRREQVTFAFDYIPGLLPIFSVAANNYLQHQKLLQATKVVQSQCQDLLSKMGKDNMDNQIIGSSHGLAQTMEQVNIVAPSDLTALIRGETGSGKEVVARAIHEQSPRADKAFIRVNCGAISPDLIDSELFGHEKGSFTGAAGVKLGWFERADGGTLFLDEIGELSLAAQTRLLRVLQEGTLNRVGGEREINVNVRIIAATHRNLSDMVNEKLFREDLWYRVNVFPIYLPSLRERKQDISALANHFSERAAKKLGLPYIAPTSNQVTTLQAYHWPGNVRELQVVMERAAILGQGKQLDIESSLGPSFKMAVPSIPIENNNEENKLDKNVSIEPLEKTIVSSINNALKVTNGKISGEGGAASLLNINPNTLRSKMRKYQIEIKYFPGNSNLLS